MKETIPSSSITWSEMRKQNIQAKEVYYHKTESNCYYLVVVIATTRFCWWFNECLTGLLMEETEQYQPLKMGIYF